MAQPNTDTASTANDNANAHAAAEADDYDSVQSSSMDTPPLKEKTQHGKDKRAAVVSRNSSLSQSLMRTLSRKFGQQRKALNESTGSLASEEGSSGEHEDGDTDDVDGKSNRYLKVGKGEGGVTCTQHRQHCHSQVRMKRKPRKQFDRLVLVQELAASPAADPNTDALQRTVSSGTFSIHNTRLLSFSGSASAATSGANTGNSAASNTATLPESDAAIIGAGAVWRMKFNRTGRYLAVGGQDQVIRIWALMSEPEEPVVATPDADPSPKSRTSPSDAETTLRDTTAPLTTARLLPPVFKSKPFREYRGHKSDVLDLSWSKVGRMM